MDNRIDRDVVNQQADLLSLLGSVNTNLIRVAMTGGGELAGPCPICGGDDRFRVQPYHQPEPRWLCHHCTGGRWKCAIDLGVLLWPGTPFREICARLAGGQLPKIGDQVPARVYAPKPVAQPALDQEAAHKVIDQARATLWQKRYSQVREYLHGRGLNDKTIDRFNLGYMATGDPNLYGRTIAGLYVPRGIVIPGMLKSEVWYLKIRLLPGVPAGCQRCKARIPGAGKCPSCGEENRYRGVKGNRTAAIFNARDLVSGTPALFVEGEFDAMLAWQEFGDLIPTATIGSATSAPDLAVWGRFFLAAGKTLILPDADEAGERAANTVAGATRYPIIVGLPEGYKDLTDYHQAGGNLRAWISELLDTYDPQPLSMFEQAGMLGAMIREVV